ncbi:MAG TPA: hypothetical protein VG846_15730, partial [Actinomycetota bacterium]|nr:hypothetical protein [Actinomycetota bacterium]
MLKTLALDLTQRLRLAQVPVPPELDMSYADWGPLPGLASVLGQAEAIMTNPRVPIDDAFLDAAPRVRFIQLTSAGFERVDIDATVRRRVTVANSSVAIAPAVA